MLKLANQLARRFGVRLERYKSDGDYHNSALASIQPAGKSRGTVLLSYIVDPFLRKPGAEISRDHTHHWESHQIAQTFLDRGYAVDVISYQNRRFAPEKPYRFFVGARNNFERLAEHLPADCRKIVHLDTAHWLFNNAAAYQRLLDVQRRRGVVLNNAKMVGPNWALEHADEATVLGNEFTMNTYAYAKKPMTRIPISNPLVYDWPEERDIERARRSYLWFGSSGFVHKGLDLVLEAFSQLPDFRLTVCGPLDQEQEFVKAFRKELYETPNITTIGWVDVAGAQFREVAGNCIGLIYPTCSEGGGGSAITCMHAGMIPVLSYEASVDVEDTGVILKDSRIETIKHAVSALSDQSPTLLKKQARAAWELARARHSQEIFARRYAEYVDATLRRYG